MLSEAQAHDRTIMSTCLRWTCSVPNSGLYLGGQRLFVPIVIVMKWTACPGISCPVRSSDCNLDPPGEWINNPSTSELVSIVE